MCQNCSTILHLKLQTEEAFFQTHFLNKTSIFSAQNYSRILARQALCYAAPEQEYSTGTLQTPSCLGQHRRHAQPTPQAGAQLPAWLHLEKGRSRGGEGKGGLCPQPKGRPGAPHAQLRLPLLPRRAGSPPAYPPVLLGVGRWRCPATSGFSPAPSPASSVPVSAASSPAPASSAPVAVPAASFLRRVGRAAGAPPAVSGPFPAGPAAAPLRLHGRARLPRAAGAVPVPPTAGKGRSPGPGEMAAAERPRQRPLRAARTSCRYHRAGRAKLRSRV